MTNQAQLKSFISSLSNSELMLGIHEVLLAKKFSICESYDPDGRLYSKTAILFNGLCHLTHHRNADFTLSLGALPKDNHKGLIDWSSLHDTVNALYGESLDEWEGMEKDQLVFGDFTTFTWNKIADAANSGERKAIAPILFAMLTVFGHYADFFWEYADNCLEGNFQGSEFTDTTLENAFISFVTFVQERVIPKLNLPVEVE